MELIEVIAEVRMFVNAETLFDAEETAGAILNEVVADIINIDAKV